MTSWFGDFVDLEGKTHSNKIPESSRTFQESNKTTLETKGINRAGRKKKKKTKKAERTKKED